MNTKIKAIILIGLSVIGYMFQLYFQKEGMTEYKHFMLVFTINPFSSWISLFTSGFMHANLLHIGMNMFMLYMLALMFVEKNSKFMTVYFLSLLLSSIFSLLYVKFIDTAFVLGASGAIFGIFSYIFFKTNRRKEFYLNFVIFNIGMVLFGMNIAWYAHLGGATAGILYYYFEHDIIPKIKRKKMKRI